MKIFNLDKRFSVVCNSEGTRSGFRHTAVLCSYGQSIGRTKICYLNRTWEGYEFESVLEKIIDENFEGQEKANFLEAIKYENLHNLR